MFTHVNRMPQFDVPEGETQNSFLRKKIDEGFSPKLIHTVRGAGYVLREEA